MFCPSCGVDSVEGLKYCKRCGTNIPGAFSAPPNRFPPILTMAFLFIIGGIFVVGLAVPMAASRDLLSAGFSTGQLMDLFLADMGLTLAVVVLLIWLLLRLTRVYQTPGATRVTQALPNEFALQQIVAPPEPVGSVTENTTRSFEARLSERVRTNDFSRINSEEIR